MKSLHERIVDIDWQAVTESMNEKGYAAVLQCLLIQN
jgi:hypothetical protein